MNNLASFRVVYIHPVDSIVKLLCNNEHGISEITNYLQGISHDLDSGLGKVDSSRKMRIFREVFVVKVEGSYYRAIVLSIVKCDQYSVFLIDQRRTVVIELSDIRLINDSVQEDVLCGIIVSQNWTVSTQLDINNIIYKHTMTATDVEEVSSVKLMKVLIDGKKDFSTVLVEKEIGSVVDIEFQKFLIMKSLHTSDCSDEFSLMKPPTQSSVIRLYPDSSEQLLETYVTHISNGPELFFVMMKNDYDVLYPLLCKRIGSVIKENISCPIVPRIPCLAYNPKNDMCRGMVTAVTDSQATVFFVDFGFIRNLPFNQIFKVPAEILALNPFAVAVKLDKLNNKLLTKSVKDKFLKLLVGSAVPLLLWFMEREDDGNKLVEAFIPEYGAIINIKDKLLYPTYNRIEILSDATYKVIISRFESISTVFVQLAAYENFNSLKEMMSNLQIHCQRACVNNYLNLNELYVGMPVAVLHEDNKWYRAIILKEPSDGQIIPVRFIDYGNNDSVCLEALQKLDLKFVELSPQAVECNLLGDINGVNDIADDNSLLRACTDFIDSKILYMKVKNLNSVGNVSAHLTDEDGIPLMALLRKKLRTMTRPAIF